MSLSLAKVASHQDGRLSWLFQWETGHPETNQFFPHWRTPSGSPWLAALHILGELSVMRKAISVECAQPYRTPLAGLFSVAFLPIIPFSFALSSFANDICSLPQQFQEQNLGETSWNFMVSGAHPLLCSNHLKMVPFYTFQQLWGIATSLGACYL